MPGKRLLVVEDDYDVAEMLVMYFTSHDYEVYHADSGSMGIEMARSRFPQVILLDVMMPDMDGYETCRRIRQATLTKYIPVIFLSQRDERANKVKGLELGADDYITKPFDIEELKLRVQGAIRRATREHLHEPRTGLPTGPLAQEELERRHYSTRSYTDLRFGLTGFKSYCDQYGFLAGDEVFGYAAQTIQQVMSEYGTNDDFVGVIEDTFVVLTAAPDAPLIEASIRRQFAQGVKAFYTFSDAERGGLLVNPGTERETTEPIMNLVQLRATV